MESYCLIGRVLVLQMKKFWRWMMVVLTRQCKGTKCHRTICLKRTKTVNFMLHIFQHNENYFL